MNDDQSAFDRFVAANPVLDANRLVSDLGLESEAREFPRRDVVSKRHVSGGRRAWVAAAVFAAVAVSALVLVSVRPGGEVATGGSAAEVVESFFARWNAAEPAAAMALVDLDVEVNGGLQGWPDLRALMLWSMEFDGRMAVECASASDDPGLVACDWAFRTAATDAIGIDPAPNRQFEVIAGRIVSITTPNYGALERVLADHARVADPEGFAVECAREAGVTSSQYGFPFTARCGRYLASLEADVVESLGS